MSLTAEQILSTRDPVVLFGTDQKKGFRKLALQWHPDRCSDPRADEVFRHITKVHAPPAPVRRLLKLAGGTLRFEEGERALLRSDGLCGSVGPLLTTMSEAVPDLERRLPKVLRAKDNATIFKLPRGAVSMAKVMESYPDGLPPVHVAWIASRLYELVMEISHAGFCCCGLAPEALAVIVKPHGVLTLDWRFSCKAGEKMTAVPRLLVPLLPHDRIASPKFDLASIHRIALVLLGDPSGLGTILLRKDPPPPRKFLDWFRSAPVLEPVDHYRTYRQLLETVFGPPKYHKLVLR